MDLVSLVPPLVAFSLAYLLGVAAGRRRLSPPRTPRVQPPLALSPAQQCEWMSQWFQENAPQAVQPLVRSHVRRSGRHAA